MTPLSAFGRHLERDSGIPRVLGTMPQAVILPVDTRAITTCSQQLRANFDTRNFGETFDVAIHRARRGFGSFHIGHRYGQ